MRTDAELLQLAVETLAAGRAANLTTEERDRAFVLARELTIIQGAGGCSSQSPAGVIDWQGNLVRWCR
jgi:hypothetical protein